MLMAAVLVMIMSPGVGFLYSGLLRRKNALSMIFLSLAIYSVRPSSASSPGPRGLFVGILWQSPGLACSAKQLTDI